MIHRHLKNIFFLGVKELISLRRDPILIGFIIYAFTLSIYLAAISMPETLHKATISIVDEDHSKLSRRIIDAFYPPYFASPTLINLGEIDNRMNAGLDNFSVGIPPKFEQDLLAGKKATIQLNIDATNVSQALSGNQHIQQLILGEINDFMQKEGSKRTPSLIDVPFRILYNPELKESWFMGVMELINNITMLAVILTGAAFLREREHGTIDHLLVMPVQPFEMMVSKIWPMMVVILVISFISLLTVLQPLISMPIEGSLFLFMIGVLLDLFATASLGIFLATFSRSMPQFAIILILVLVPLLVLSGGVTPSDSMPPIIQNIMAFTPHIHFVQLAQSILFRGAGLAVVLPQFFYLFLMGVLLFLISLMRFRKTLSSTA